VPKIRREENERPAITNGCTAIDIGSEDKAWWSACLAGGCFRPDPPRPEPSGEGAEPAAPVRGVLTPGVRARVKS